MSDRATATQMKQRIESETQEEREARWTKAAQDSHRPQYHYQPPPAWMNDPNGPFSWKGVYHMFYQYNPGKPFWGDMHWGHAVSPDLVRWTTVPIALAPTPGGPDKDGCFSGCAVDDDSVPTFVYTGVSPEVQCIATSTDDLMTWQKYAGNPVISAPPAGLTVTGFRDPCVWKEENVWYMLIGSGIKDAGGTSFLYRSTDLIDWEYLHPLYACDRARPMHECPDFFPLGDQHVLLTSADGMHWDVGACANHTFTPERHGRVDWGHYYAARTLLAADGRRLMWGWITEGRSEEEQILAGWSGALSLTRVLTLGSDHTLRMEPVTELHTLRGRHWRFDDLTLGPSDDTRPLDGVQGDCLELIARFAPNDAKTFGVIVQGTDRIGYDRQTQQVLQAPLELASDEEMVLRIFVDRSVTEVFANSRACQTLRTYHKPTDSRDVRVFAHGGRATVTSIDIWEMKSM